MYAPVSETWYDPSSGLTWQLTLTSGTVEWQEAKDHCSSLFLDGGGWRLPTVDELRSLIRGCPETVTGGSCGVSGGCLGSSCKENAGDCYCSYQDGPAGGCYWPSEIPGICNRWCWASSPVEGLDSFAWKVNFSQGRIDDEFDGFSSGNYARCVR